MARSERLDKLLVARGLAPSRERAQGLILAGRVLVEGKPALKAGAPTAPDAGITLLEDPCPYVSRGGLKLAGALDAFGLSPAGRLCLDVGASTGGFTDCLLQRGARRVVCVDVGRGLLDWKLRNDPRVTLLEGVNARHLAPGAFAEAAGPEKPDLATLDLSFISVTKVLLPVRALLAPGADILILVKPQFEAGKGKVGKGGVVRDPALHQEAVEGVRRFCEENGLAFRAQCESPITGAKGNREFFVWVAIP
jgi:23S rRNA (cytidine1920-2'-O)/16S rRNA (cytidine1409-2'-O)-methyltransferase